MIRPGAASWAVPGRFCVPADACQTSASAVLWVCVGGGGVCSVCFWLRACGCGVGGSSGGSGGSFGGVAGGMI